MDSKLKMRRVNVLKSDTSGTYVQGKGYPMVMDYCGHFHGWGVELHEQEEGSTNYTIAIVEKEDGSIGMVYPTHIQFVEEIEDVPFVQFKSLIIRTDVIEEGDGLDADEITDLRNCQQFGWEVKVICEAADGYYDVICPNGRCIRALASYHLQALVR